jgi:hypothetical protein
MDWQQSVSLLIVGVTALAFASRKLRRRKFDFAKDTHCGCGSSQDGARQSIVLRARKGERRQVIVKMH